MLGFRFILILLTLSLFSFNIYAKKYNSKKESVSVLEQKKEKSDNEYKYVIFDISNVFWEKTLYEILMSLKKKIHIPFSGYVDLLECGVSYAFGNLDAKKGYEVLFKHMKKMPKVDVQTKCNLIWEQDCKNYIYEEADRLFKKYKSEGKILIAVDAGISELYNEFLKIYKFDYIFVSKMEYKDGVSTGKLDGEPCSNKYKYETIKNLIENKLQGSLKDAIFYANSHNDIPLLEHVGKPITVNPNKKLLKKAKKENWPIIEFKKLLKSN